LNVNGTILVVEDQDSARESLAELLRGEGYEVREAADGNVAKDLINKLDVDVILTDLMMPGADGIEVLKHAREVSPQTLIMLMTAHASVDTAVEALRLGAQDYLLKPLIFEDVMRKVERLKIRSCAARSMVILVRTGRSDAARRCKKSQT